MEETTVVEEVAQEETTEVQEETTEVAREEEVVEETTEKVIEEDSRKQTAQERINEITRARREAEREAEYWKNLAIKPEPVKETPSGRPKVGNYETTEEYEDALIGWHDNKRVAATGVAEQQRRQTDMLKTFNAKAAGLRKAHGDFDEIIESPVFTDIMREVVLSADTGPELAYYLGSNREVAQRIAQLPPAMQPYEIGKLETQIKLAQKTKTITGAPAPIVPTGSITGGGEKDPSKMTTAEWMNYEKNREMDKLKTKFGG
ncbi:MAG: hypothetical protein Q7J27_02015 [Syntrophales bacterium]|nr:hypothetical protein [Syntrophales bacterium]